MPKLSRRAMFPLFAVGGIAAADGSQGASFDATLPGIVTRLSKMHGQGWCFLVPDLDSMDGWWMPGMAVPTKWMPVAEYLKLIDEAFSKES